MLKIGALNLDCKQNFGFSQMKSLVTQVFEILIRSVKKNMYQNFYLYGSNLMYNIILKQNFTLKISFRSMKCQTSAGLP